MAVGKPPRTMKEKADRVVSRYGKTTKGTAEKPRPSTTVKPKGTNPLKGRYGVEVKRTF